MTDAGRPPAPEPSAAPQAEPSAPLVPAEPPAPSVPPVRAEPRPWLERVGLAAIAMVMGTLLAVMAAVAWAGGEGILAAMSASGAILTMGVGLLTLVRG